MEVSPDVTHLLAQARGGDAGAMRRLVPLVYDELRVLAHRQRQRRPAAETLNTTALVHEAYEKLAHSGKTFADRQHFFRVAARAMRGVLVDAARARQAAKRGGGATVLPLDAERVALPEDDPVLLALDAALTQLAAAEPRMAEVVELRYFVGLTIPETAEVLGLSETTVKREWAAARAWLHHALSSG